jgi:nitrogen fixation protein FixH
MTQAKIGPMTPALATDRPRRSLIPWIFVGAMAVVVAVNAVMISFAVGSWTGLSVPKPYERGVAYNRVLAAQHRQDALGWRLEAEVAPGAGADRPDGARLITLRAVGPDGAPLPGLGLEARLVRPIEVLPDLPVAFRPAGPGLYVAEVVPAKPGQWDLRVDAARGGDRFHLVQRLVLR